jgi:hypothetical protein
MTVKKTLFFGALAAMTASVGAAHAHAVVSPDKAAPGGYYAGQLRISHGCNGSPTVAVRVEIPAGVTSARPQPKTGWTVKIEREPLAEPVKGEGGQVIRDRVKAITWSGNLPDDMFENFGLMLKLPAVAGPLYLPTVQTCKVGANRWTDIPAPGAAWNSVANPAPVLTLGAPAGEPAAPTAPAAEDPHAHHHH